MSGDYLLVDVEVYRAPIGDGPGVYLLFRAYSQTPDYVGRSDTDLRERLLQHARRGRYRRFRFERHDDEDSAFRRECSLWHYYRGAHGELDNKIAPARPSGCDCCHVCGQH